MLRNHLFGLAYSLCFAHRFSGGALLSFEIVDHFLCRVSVQLIPRRSLGLVVLGLLLWFRSWFWSTILNFRFHSESNLKFIVELGSFSFRTAAGSHGIGRFHQVVFLHVLLAFCALGLRMIVSFIVDWITPTRKLAAQQEQRCSLDFDQIPKFASSSKFWLLLFKRVNFCHFYLVF